MNEQHLYYQKALNNWNYLEDNKTKTNNTQFNNINNFDNSKTISFIILNKVTYSIEDNISQQLKKEENNI